MVIRVDTTGTVAKTIDWWDINPFTAFWLLPTLLLLLVWYVGLPKNFKHREPTVRARGFRLYQRLLPGIALAFVCWLLLEEYLLAECPVSKDRYDDTHELFRRNIQVLEEHGVTWWADDGTILAILREKPGFNPWDQDCDTYAVYQGSEWLGDLLDLLQLTNEPHDVEVSYIPHRSLIQMSKSNGAHMDIWIWRRESDLPESRRAALQEVNFLPRPETEEERSLPGGVRLPTGKSAANARKHTYSDLPGPEEFIVNPDFTFALYDVTHVPVSMVLPTKMREWAGMQVRMPAKPHDRARQQFGPNYMTPYYNRFMCLENIGTGRPSPTRKFIWFVIIAGTPFLAFAFADKIMSFMFRRRHSSSAPHVMAPLPA